MTNSPTRDWWARGFGIFATIGVIVTCLSLCVDIRTSKLHLEPSVKCFLEVADNNKLRFTIKNDGLLTASLLSVAYYELYYFPEKEIISVMSAQTTELSDVPGSDWLYVENLEPNNSKSKFVTDNRNQVRDYISIFFLESHFYRQEDMKLFTRESIFFADRNNIYSHDEFKERPDYKQIRREIDTRLREWFNSSKSYRRVFKPFVSD